MRELDWDGRTLRVRVVGEVSKREIINAARSITADTRYDGLQFVIVDFLDAAVSDVRLLDVLDDLLVVLLGAFSSNPNVRIAVVARDPYIVDLANALVRFDHENLPPLRVFSDRPDAAMWISATPPLQRPAARYRSK